MTHRGYWTYPPWTEEYKSYRTNARLRSQRLRSAKAKGRHTKAQWLALCRALGDSCLRCGADLCGRPSKDHIVPIYAGGSDAIDNIQPLCLHCNLSKSSESREHRPENWWDLMVLELEVVE